MGFDPVRSPTTSLARKSETEVVSCGVSTPFFEDDELFAPLRYPYDRCCRYTHIKVLKIEKWAIKDLFCCDEVRKFIHVHSFTTSFFFHGFPVSFAA